jgi:hypothetical protein
MKFPSRRTGALPGPAKFLVAAGLLFASACSEAPDPIAAPPLGLAQAGPGSAAFQATSAYAPGRVLARFQPGARAGDIAVANGAAIRGEVAFGIQMLSVPEGREVAVSNALGRNPNVVWAEPDFIRTVNIPCDNGTGNCGAPDDPYLGYKWDLHNDGTINNSLGDDLGSSGNPDADMDWLEAYDHLDGDHGGTAVLGIMDTGILANHVDLQGRVVAQYDFHDDDPDATDDNGHGTHVAGIAVGRGNDGAGVPGVAWGSGIDLVIAKVCGPISPPIFGQRYGCYNSSTAAGVEWAVLQGANVLNLSLGGSSASQAEQDALSAARTANVLPVCAAGNDGGAVSFPAALASCVAVSATDWNDDLATYSNFGSQVELSAPGGDSESADGYSYILSSYNSSSTGYVFMAGTSMASPQVAGLATLLHALGVTGAEAKLDRMKQTADDLGSSGDDDLFGAGRVNVYAAVTNTTGGGGGNTPPNVDPVAAFSGGPCTVDVACALTDESTDTDGSVVAWDWDFGGGNSSTAQDPTYTWTAAGSFDVTLTVTDDDGGTHSVTQPVTVEAGDPPPTGGIVVTLTADKDKGQHLVIVEWSGAAGPVDIWRDGGLVQEGVGSGSGSYPDATGNRGGITYTYRVCEAGSNTCTEQSVTY